MDPSYNGTSCSTHTYTPRICVPVALILGCVYAFTGEGQQQCPVVAGAGAGHPGPRTLDAGRPEAAVWHAGHGLRPVLPLGKDQSWPPDQIRNSARALCTLVHPVIVM